MSIRFKAVAAALGLIVAAGSIGTAAADTVVKTTTRHGGLITKSVKIVHRANRRVYVGTRIVKHIRIVRRVPVLARPHLAVIYPHGVRTYGVRTITTKKIVRVTRGPLQRHAMFHRVGSPAVVIR